MKLEQTLNPKVFEVIVAHKITYSAFAKPSAVFAVILIICLGHKQNGLRLLWRLSSL